MNNPLLAIQSQYWAVRDYLSPVLRESKFKEHGRITPDEFVAAGDFLTFKFPVWQWEKGDSNRIRDFLPADKQYLITRNVPCLRRATAVNYTDADEDAEKLMSFLDEAEEAPGPGGKASTIGGDDDWVATHIGRPPQATAGEMGEIPDMTDSPPLPTKALAGLSVSDSARAGGAKQVGTGELVEETISKDDIPDLDDIPDMDDVDEGAGLEDEDDAAVRIVHPSEAEVKSTVGQNLLQVRTYDCLISYDKHYQTPRFWLFGYDENKTPLSPVQVFQDVPADHAFKTMTMEAFPHSGQQLASVHPCKHASVMKKFIDRMEAAQADGSAGLAGKGAGAGVGAGAGAGPGEKKKKGWGIGGMVRKVTGGSVSVSSSAVAGAGAGGQAEKKQEVGTAGEETEPQGVQVDFYLVIFLKFIASIVPTIEVDSTTSTML